jgi:hypothetical protein
MKVFFGGVAMAAVALSLASAGPAAAQLAHPQTMAGVSAQDSQNTVTQVQWRGRRGGWHGGGGWRGHRGGGWGGAGVGFAAGALLGGAIAAGSQPYYGPGPYYAPAPVYGGGGQDDAYCLSRFKSYDPASGTYLGYDGMRHPCP